MIMNALSRRTLLHDWPIITLMLLNLAAIGLYLGLDQIQQQGSSYRLIDATAVKRLLDAGELSSREADWYQVNLPEGKEN